MNNIYNKMIDKVNTVTIYKEMFIILSSIDKKGH